MKKVIKTFIVLMLLFAVGPPLLRGDVLDFDDVLAENSYIPDGYEGFDWVNFGVTRNSDLGSGFNSGTLSGDCVAFNAWAEPASITSSDIFDFDGAYLTAAWRNGLNVTVAGYEDDSLLYTRTIVVDTFGDIEATPEDERWFEFNYVGINKLEFTSFGGIEVFSNCGGRHFAMDDFEFTRSVPISNPSPGAILLGSIGVGLVGWLRRRRSL